MKNSHFSIRYLSKSWPHRQAQYSNNTVLKILLKQRLKLRLINAMKMIIKCLSEWLSALLQNLRLNGAVVDRIRSLQRRWARRNLILQSLIKTISRSFRNCLRILYRMGLKILQHNKVTLNGESNARVRFRLRLTSEKLLISSDIVNKSSNRLIALILMHMLTRNGKSRVCYFRAVNCQVNSICGRRSFRSKTGPGQPFSSHQRKS